MSFITNKNNCAGLTSDVDAASQLICSGTAFLSASLSALTLFPENERPLINPLVSALISNLYKNPRGRAHYLHASSVSYRDARYTKYRF